MRCEHLIKTLTGPDKARGHQEKGSVFSVEVSLICSLLPREHDHVPTPTYIYMPYMHLETRGSPAASQAVDENQLPLVEAFASLLSPSNDPSNVSVYESVLRAAAAQRDFHAADRCGVRRGRRRGVRRGSAWWRSWRRWCLWAFWLG